MSYIVKAWYETKENVNEMIQWERPNLKKWELAVTRFFPKNAKLLDIGCGLGREAFVLSDMGFKVVGIDISQEVIQQVVALSAQKGYDMDFRLYDGHMLPFEADSFDVIIIWAQTFGLIYGDECKHDFLLECKRILTSDGLLSFSGHDYNFEMDNYKNCMKEGKFYPYADTELYWETFQPNDLISFAKNAGYTVILCEKGEIYTSEDGTIIHCLCRKEL
ncbi:class I SAM-dependent methyltransferase [Anaerosporobacter sp.]|uniref:class I SAM-dependent methyltransferase n=1 Tax=Anaerosporobacter sp. TaxID=1872529 RepID=UPI00286F339F|nr:class I SAM-dependent methyltransferase [Anaerosporobacter sp.]